MWPRPSCKLRGLGFRNKVPLKQIEYGVYGDLIIIYPKPLLKGDYITFGSGAEARGSSPAPFLRAQTRELGFWA